jgi:hypothetical protein
VHTSLACCEALDDGVDIGRVDLHAALVDLVALAARAAPAGRCASMMPMSPVRTSRR